MRICSELKVGDTGEPPEFLRFYLNGDPQLVFPLYEMIFNQASAVEFRAKETPIGNKTLMTLTNIQLKTARSGYFARRCYQTSRF